MIEQLGLQKHLPQDSDELIEEVQQRFLSEALNDDNNRQYHSNPAIKHLGRFRRQKNDEKSSLRSRGSRRGRSSKKGRGSRYSDIMLPDEDASQMNTVYSRIMSATQATKIKKLIGKRNIALDVRA